MNDDDSRLQQQLSNTLDHSLEQLDERTLQQLQQIRQQAQRPSKRQWRPALAMAASILLMIAVPWIMHKPPASDPSLLLGEHYLSVEPDMLADWEMLEAIAEVPDA
ncbi:MAG: hypothetical protein CMK83_25440 [Pseudomonadales bacterium]|jgi:ferric-dicitrate binding protein FerR (iron transport regulator)|nr:hypothetical protein [Pseudomonadales bacterium]MCK5790063.1 hypothetical protein [Ketobacter sp.]TNC84993.1 MAG: hypothetical protein CSH49_18500 [Alcanivorax sp.]HAG93264.1 hypothetical protein [Gammaproteobacteria bacterium]MAQ27565.1 hypothetical protein [Pseudomonadales bacterium]|tara:strand:- start:1721 stop:2038 length:318 start_codon:yes stop_codon:yes gene_type:complete